MICCQGKDSDCVRYLSGTSSTYQGRAAKAKPKLSEFQATYWVAKLCVLVGRSASVEVVFV